MILLAVLFFLAALGLATYGAYIGYLRLRHDTFIRSGRAEVAKGTCATLRWTSGGLVASGIRYVDKEGCRRLVWSRAQASTPVPVGGTAQVTYDPDGKANALVNGVATGIGSYGFAAGCLILSAIFFFNGVGQV
ncbi:hypothetical protein [Streptomyces sp. NBC_01618]|uniref:hypothetical protein n=1 Tax=Streptomyces sp. NBC_01618 TaxID=2975900 RepID=UPI0038638ED3|nr:hypothetical protein OH735_22120 [Streptomyces sp. NBC_01618]